tara:strand:- start:403 stop:672 length:270 start_codon:yes stop_codon:yes gene_type:complete
MNRVIDEFTREEYELLYSAFKSFRVYMNDAEEVIAEQILDKVFYPSFDAQQRTDDLKASQEFRSEVDELVADAEEALAEESGIKSLNFR